ncbi:hypothetical protein EDC96DRAFT_475024 [Choanephora cucurbitarum]|nr:hypothetical protein EDC96DRAFT_475024 [Choanephora cucurbitarum]
MAKKTSNSKAEAANGRKAAAKAEKDQKKQMDLEAKEDAKWTKGAKKNDKKEAEASKKADLLQKKLEKQRILAEEEAALNKKPKANKPSGVRKMVFNPSGPAESSKVTDKKEFRLLTENDVEKHPERRFKHALQEFEDRELKNFRAQYPGLRLSQLKQIIYKEFQKSPENPFNQSNVVAYNTKLDELNSELVDEEEVDVIDTTVTMVKELTVSSY